MRNNLAAGPEQAAADSGDRLGPATPVQSVDRALTILQMLAESGELGVTEITARLDLAREGGPVCRQLAGEINETVNIAVMDAGAAVNITQEQGSAAVSAQNWIGQRTPLHATSSGKVLLAWADADALAAVLEAGLERRTPATITDPEALRAELDRIRQRGWACTVEELETGLNTVAAPVRGADGSVVAGLSASGPSYRLGTESFPELAKKLQAGADEISSQLGYYRSQKAPSDG